MPPEDFANAELDIELPPGGTLDDTAAGLRGCRCGAEAIARSHRLIEFVGGEDGEIRNAVIYISLVPRSERKMSQKQWEQT